MDGFMDPLDVTVIAIAKQLNGLVDLVLAKYRPLVDSVLRGEITDLRSMEAILDGLGGFVEYPTCRDLYEKLCAFVSRIDPQLVEEHKAITCSSSNTSSL